MKEKQGEGEARLAKYQQPINTNKEEKCIDITMLFSSKTVKKSNEHVHNGNSKRVLN